MAIKESKAPNVGSIVWWNINGEYKRVHINTLAAKHTVRLPKKALRSSFSNALRDLNTSSDMVVKKHSENIMAVVMVIAETKKKRDLRELEWGEQSWVQFEKQTGAVTWRERDPRTERFAERFKYHQEHYTAHDIRMMIDGEVQKSGAISLRSAGGIYFLPETSRPRIMQLSSFLDDLGTGAFISIVGIPKADAIAVKSVQRDFEENGILTLDSLIASADETLKAGEGVDYDQRQRTLKQLLLLEKQSESMEALLEFKAGRLAKKIKQVRERINITLNGE